MEKRRFLLWMGKGCQDETSSPKRMMKGQRIVRENTGEPINVKDETKRIWQARL